MRQHVASAPPGRRPRPRPANPVVAACLGGPSAQCVGTINARLQQVSTGLDQILQSLRDAGGSDLTIAVTTYYNSFVPPCRYAALGGLAQVVLEGPVPGGLFPAGLNGLLRAEAREVGARVVGTAGLIGPDQLVGDCLHPRTAPGTPRSPVPWAPPWGTSR